MTEQTLIIVKPDAVQAEKTNVIFASFQDHGFRLLASKQLHLSPSQAQDFYAEHRGKPFFHNLIDFMTSGPCVVAVLEAEDAVRAARNLVGTTDPTLAQPGTLRHCYGSSTTKNAVHASDSPQSARREIPCFFPNFLDHSPSAAEEPKE
jgi:nucleoside-diphosphate kinase